MKKPVFRSLAEQFYVGRITIQNDMGVDKLSQFLLTLGVDGLTRFVDNSLIRLQRTKDPDAILATHTYTSELPVYYLSEVMSDITKVDNISKVYYTLYNALKKLRHPQLRELAIRNIDFDYAMMKFTISSLLQITEPAEALEAAFAWNHTTEGVVFWSSVHEAEASGFDSLAFKRDLESVIGKYLKPTKLRHITIEEIAKQFNLTPEQVVIV